MFCMIVDNYNEMDWVIMLLTCWEHNLYLERYMQLASFLDSFEIWEESLWKNIPMNGPNFIKKGTVYYFAPM